MKWKHVLSRRKAMSNSGDIDLIPHYLKCLSELKNIFVRQKLPFLALKFNEQIIISKQRAIGIIKQCFILLYWPSTKFNETPH